MPSHWLFHLAGLSIPVGHQPGLPGLPGSFSFAHPVHRPFLLLCLTSSPCSVRQPAANVAKPPPGLTHPLSKRWLYSLSFFSYLIWPSAQETGTPPRLCCSCHPLGEAAFFSGQLSRTRLGAKLPVPMASH